MGKEGEPIPNSAEIPVSIGRRRLIRLIVAGTLAFLAGPHSPTTCTPSLINRGNNFRRDPK
jgi:hypothetical protein